MLASRGLGPRRVPHDRRQRGRLVHIFVKHGLQREQLLLGHEEQRIGERVPLRDGREDGDRRQNRRDQREMIRVKMTQ